RREEALRDAFEERVNTITRALKYLFYPRRSQNADSYSLEMRAPLISVSNARLFVRELDLQASIRRDRYTTRRLGGGTVSLVSRDGPFPALAYSTSRLASSDYTVGLRY